MTTNTLSAMDSIFLVTAMDYGCLGAMTDELVLYSGWLAKYRAAFFWIQLPLAEVVLKTAIYFDSD